jgi:beta-xylosidase
MDLIRLVIVVCILAAWHPRVSSAQPRPAPRVGTFANPIDVIGADPYVLFHNGLYYMYLATHTSPSVDVYTSRDLGRWRHAGVAYGPGGWAKRLLWAPCVVRHGGRFLMYYNAINDDGVGHRISVSVADRPAGPFRDLRTPLWDPGFAVIDADVFVDRDGRGYLYFSKDISQGEVSASWVVPLSRDLLSVTGDPVLCVEPTLEWEGKWNEAPFVFRERDTYFLLYSGTNFTYPEYAVGYAVSDSPLGPWRKPQETPILARTPSVSGPGHPCVTPSPDGRERYLVYHTHQQLTGGVERQIAADRMRIVENPHGELRLQIDGPTRLPQKTPSGVVGPLAAATDQFDSPALNRDRWTIVNEDSRSWRLRSGSLVITTQDGDMWGPRFDIRNLFLQSPLPGDFQFDTRVRLRVQRNYDQAFLIVWQDHDNYIRLSHAWVGGRRWQVVRELEGEIVRHEVPNTIGDSPWMRISKRGRSYQCEASLDGTKWWPVGPPLAADFGEIQIGLGATCPGGGRNVDAEFELFRFRGGTPAATRLGTPSAPSR